MEKFKTIKENVTAQIVEKKSKFIAELYYVETQKEAEKILENTRKKYYDAKHHCYSYRITENNEIIERASDDGEPSGTAGMPMLNILQKNNLSNIIVIVTRYFGGILLGTGGLVRAYSDSTLKAIEVADIIEKTKGVEIEIEIEYANLEKFKYFCRKNEISITEMNYLSKVTLKCEMSKKSKDILTLKENIKDLKIEKYEIKGDKFIEL